MIIFLRSEIKKNMVALVKCNKTNLICVFALAILWVLAGCNSPSRQAKKIHKLLNIVETGNWREKNKALDKLVSLGEPAIDSIFNRLYLVDIDTCFAYASEPLFFIRVRRMDRSLPERLK